MYEAFPLIVGKGPKELAKCRKARPSETIKMPEDILAAVAESSPTLTIWKEFDQADIESVSRENP